MAITQSLLVGEGALFGIAHTELRLKLQQTYQEQLPTHPPLTTYWHPPHAIMHASTLCINTSFHILGTQGMPLDITMYWL